MKITLGLGCDRNTPISTLRAAITAALGVSRQRMSDVVGVGSIDLKADEPALLQLVAEENWPIRFYPAAELAQSMCRTRRKPSANIPAPPRSPKLPLC